jgi:hypothetical protein
VYDSFGRDISLKQKNNIMTEDDAEQTPKEQNCGARCVAWLVVVAVKGIKTALTILYIIIIYKTVKIKAFCFYRYERS